MRDIPFRNFCHNSEICETFLPLYWLNTSYLASLNFRIQCWKNSSQKFHHDSSLALDLSHIAIRRQQPKLLHTMACTTSHPEAASKPLHATSYIFWIPPDEIFLGLLIFRSLMFCSYARNLPYPEQEEVSISEDHPVVILIVVFSQISFSPITGCLKLGRSIWQISRSADCRHCSWDDYECCCCYVATVRCSWAGFEISSSQYPKMKWAS